MPSGTGREVRGFSFLGSLQWEGAGDMGGRRNRTAWKEEGVWVSAGDADGGQVSHARGFGLCSRALGWVL